MPSDLPSTLRRKRAPGRAAASVACGLLAFALAPGAAASDSATGTDAGSGSIGQYLVDHQDDLAPFFATNSAALASDAFRSLFAVAGEMLVLLLIGTWVLDVILGRAYSALIAPAYATINRALIFSSGRLALNLILTAVLAADLTSCLTLMGPGATTLIIFALLSLSAFVVQVVWFSKVYRCSLPNALVFYVGLLVIHAATISLVVPLFFMPLVDRGIIAYVNQSVAPRLQHAADEARSEADLTSGPRDAVKKAVTDLEERITAARAGEDRLQKAIEDQKNSAAYAFTGLVKLRAEGKLAEAREKLADLIQRFPNDPITPAAQGQVTEIDQALAAQAEIKKEQDAAAAQAADQARANLLARAAQGQVTLSEMRLALIGKTRAEVTGLFGPPTDTASDRWGYGQRMILNPLNDSHLGLTVVFVNGVVQGVDYYYGSAP